MKDYDIPARLKELRNKAGLTQGQASSAIGRPKHDLVDWERGKTLPNADVFIELCILYGVKEILDEFPPKQNDVFADKPHLMPIAAHDKNSNLEDLQRDIDEL